MVLKKTPTGRLAVTAGRKGRAVSGGGPMSRKEMDEWMAAQIARRQGGRQAPAKTAEQIRNEKAEALRERAKPYLPFSPGIKSLEEALTQKPKKKGRK